MFVFQSIRARKKEQTTVTSYAVWVHRLKRNAKGKFNDWSFYRVVEVFGCRNV